MGKVSFLHLSDLHCEKSELKDMNLVVAALFDDLSSLRASGQFFDYVMFTGDLVATGDVDEFFAAYDRLISPLLRVLELPQARFFYCPGNHEVHRLSCDLVSRKGLDSLKSREEINGFIDSMKDTYYHLKGLENYNSFRNILLEQNPYLRTQSPLYCTFQLPENIGIACLNSAWRAWGGQEDNGKIAIGERQLDDALASISNSKFTIALFHHPLEYLAEYDRIAVKPRLSKFNLVCTGHLHGPEASLTQQYGSQFVMVTTGALFETRDSFIGYSIINSDTDTGGIEISVRQYHDRLRAFGPANGYLPNGMAKFMLKIQKFGQEPPKNLAVRDEERARIEERINNSLVPSISGSTYAPRRLRELFVEPCLAADSEYKQDANSEKFSLEELLGEDSILFFFGKKESGKTTILNYIALQYLDTVGTETYRLPVLLDFKAIPTVGHNPFNRAIYDYLSSLDIRLEVKVETALERGDFLLLLDNVDLSDTTRLNSLRSFLTKNPRNRVVCTSEENVVDELQNQESPELGAKVRKVFIHSLKNKQIRRLTQKWFGGADFGGVDIQEISYKSVISLLKMHLPRTPMMISLILRILESQPDFQALNRATLVEQFVTVLLGKLKVDESRTSSFDFRHKEAFLAYLAKTMSLQNRYHVEPVEFRALVSDYFNRMGLDAPIDSFCNTLFHNGVLMRDRGIICFRFRCFEEYYCAKAMIDDPEFRAHVLQQENYLRFINELDYLSGLQRNNQDILELVKSRLVESLNHLPTVDLESLDCLKIERVLVRALGEKGVASLDELQVDDEKRDEIIDQHKEPPDVQTSPKGAPRLTNWQETFLTLILYSRLLRNSELLDHVCKIDALDRCMTGYCKLLGCLYLEMDKRLDELKDEEKNAVRYFLTVILPIMFQAVIEESLGTTKLSLQVKHLMNQPHGDFTKLMYIALYGDLELPDYLDKYRTYVHEVHNRDLLEVCLLKLFWYYVWRPYRRPRREEMESLIAEIHVRATKGTNQDKALVIQKVRRERLEIDIREAASS